MALKQDACYDDEMVKHSSAPRRAPIMARSYHNFYNRTCFRLWFQVRYISRALHLNPFSNSTLSLVSSYSTSSISRRYAVWVPGQCSRNFSVRYSYDSWTRFTLCVPLNTKPLSRSPPTSIIDPRESLLSSLSSSALYLPGIGILILRSRTNCTILPRRPLIGL